MGRCYVGPDAQPSIVELTELNACAGKMTRQLRIFDDVHNFPRLPTGMNCCIVSRSSLSITSVMNASVALRNFTLRNIFAQHVIKQNAHTHTHAHTHTRTHTQTNTHTHFLPNQHSHCELRVPQHGERELSQPALGATRLFGRTCTNRGAKCANLGKWLKCLGRIGDRMNNFLGELRKNVGQRCATVTCATRCGENCRNPSTCGSITSGALILVYNADRNAWRNTCFT